MDYDAGDIKIECQVLRRKRFLPYASITSEDKYTCFDFAFDMSFGGKGEHRTYRSGGTEKRTDGQIFINTFQGKMAEFALYRYLQSRNIELDPPDVSCFDLGKWDSFDLKCQEKYLSVKSTSFKGNLLLLETKDWDENGEYIPNHKEKKEENKETKETKETEEKEEKEENIRYDYVVLVRFNPDGKQIMKDNNLLEVTSLAPKEIHEILIEKIRDREWEYDIPGFIYHSELVKMIRDRRKIPKGSILNGSTKMDAENYYFQTGNMHSVVEMYTYDLDEKEERADVRLIRKCPECGKNLVVRPGKFGEFWGCEGYKGKDGCCHTEQKEKFKKKIFNTTEHK